MSWMERPMNEIFGEPHSIDMLAWVAEKWQTQEFHETFHNISDLTSFINKVKECMQDTDFGT